MVAILLIADDAVPAAERLKNVAPGASRRKPGVRLSGDAEPRKGRKTLRRVFRPYGAEFNTNTNPGLAPGATVLKPLRGHEQSECKPDRAQPSRHEQSECKPDRAQPSRH